MTHKAVGHKSAMQLYGMAIIHEVLLQTLGKKAVVTQRGNLFKIYVMQDTLDQCPMPINADQDPGIDPNVDQFRSMPINSNQFLSMSINARSSIMY